MVKRSKSCGSATVLCGYQRARVGRVTHWCVGGAEARANVNQSNMVHLVANGGHQRARVGQVARESVGGAAWG